VSGERWFYRDDAEWAAIAERLKRTACPHCRVVGTLIRHGVLVGFDDGSPRRTVRAKRVFCSNRHRRSGCGRTVSVWFADKIRRLSLTARTVWGFLRRAVAGSLAHCFACRKNLNNIDLLLAEGHTFRSAVALLEQWLDQYQARRPRNKTTN